jgi:hypothetical protein
MGLACTGTDCVHPAQGGSLFWQATSKEHPGLLQEGKWAVMGTLCLNLKDSETWTHWVSHEGDFKPKFICADHAIGNFRAQGTSCVLPPAAKSSIFALGNHNL